MSIEIPKKYDPKIEEAKIRALWDTIQVYKFDQNTEKKIYSIDTPPPTMSGKMHIGHASSYTQTDLIARFKRMSGFEVFYPFGTDDNGLPTEKLVQKVKKVNLRKVTRTEAIKICTDYLAENREAFIQDWKNIGVSCDFSLAYSTIDKHSQTIAQKSFLALAKKKRVYRKEAPILWDTQFQSAIAQADLEDIERQSFFNDIVFKLEDGSDLTIGTTRPELLSACVAIFAHPDDERYKPLFGTFATTPIYNARVQILADEHADPQKGTGAVMCCTFGDQTDIEWFKKHNLELKMAITPYGKMGALAGAYEGLTIEDARKQIIIDLKEAGLLTAQKEITQTVNVGERSGRPVEIINSPQWYVKYLDSKEEFLAASEKLKWTPNHMKHRVENWIKGLSWDWGIARQRHFGIPIPVWYGDDGNIYYADESQLPIDPMVDRPINIPEGVKLTPETDVFDTWFTSSSSPFLATQLPQLIGTPVEKKLFPMDLRPQAHDIINTWLFYTMAKTHLLHDGVNPWETTAISGWVLDPKGKKMSKSKGNVVDPHQVMEKYSADAIRFWAAGAKLGDDYSYAERDLQTANKLVTKLWNASKFADFHLQNYDGVKPEKLEAIDEWILTKLNETIVKATASFEALDYAKAKREIESFFWNDLCDNYLEIVKDRLYKPEVYGDIPRKSGQWTTQTVFANVLKLFAPYVPYVTESLYQYFFKEDDVVSIHRSSWPKPIANVNESFATGDVAVEIVSSVRRAKAEAGVSLAKELDSVTVTGADESALSGFLADVRGATKSASIIFVAGEEFSVRIVLKPDEE